MILRDLSSHRATRANVHSAVERFRRASLIDTTIISNLSVTEVEEISLDAKFAIYRVTQEALNNIEKHSQATRTLVTVRHNIQELVICIEDNGMGWWCGSRHRVIPMSNLSGMPFSGTAGIERMRSSLLS